MKTDGVTLDAERSHLGGVAVLVTNDSTIADKYGMHDERELWDEGGPAGQAGE